MKNELGMLVHISGPSTPEAKAEGYQARLGYTANPNKAKENQTNTKEKTNFLIQKKAS